MFRLLTSLLLFPTSFVLAQETKKKAPAPAAPPFAWVSPMQNAAWAKKSLPATVRHATFKSPSMGIEVG